MDLENELKRIMPNDVCSLLKRKFVVERMYRFFTVDEKFQFQKDGLALDQNNSILIRFKGTDRNHPYN